MQVSDKAEHLIAQIQEVHKATVQNFYKTLGLNTKKVLTGRGMLWNLTKEILYELF